MTGGTVGHATFGFDGAFLQKLERLALLNRRPIPGPSAGPRRSPRRGSSVEFADFRDYSPGDDFRRIDWKALARLDRLFLRLYSAEEMTTVTLCLDHSASMSFGEPPKALTCARLAAVFSYVALHSFDRVAVAGWGEGADRYLPPMSGKGNVPQVWNYIAGLMDTPSGGTNMAALRQTMGHRRQRGLAVVISDLLTDGDWRMGLRGLQAAGQEVHVIQVLSPDELNPTVRGDWKLRDAETGRDLEITISPRVLKRYAAELEAHTTAIREFCRRSGMTYLQLPSDVPLGDLMLRSLYRSGVVG